MGTDDTGDKTDPSSSDGAKPWTAAPISATPNGPSRVVVKRWFEVRIAQHGKNSYEPVYQAAMASHTHYVYQKINSATRSELITVMQEAEAGEILTTDTHCSIHPRTLYAVGIVGENLVLPWGGEVLLLADMVTALKVKSPPSAVVLCGCNSADLIADLVAKAGVSVAFGIAGDRTAGLSGFVQMAKATAVAQAVTAALVIGKTIEEAQKAGTDEIEADGLQVMIETAPGVDPKLSLKDNNLIPSP